jgi:hypothetical protein
MHLSQPEAHVHLAVQRRGRSEVLSGPRLAACVAVEPAEVEVAVGDERAHPDLGGERQSLAIAGFGRCAPARSSLRSPGSRWRMPSFAGASASERLVGQLKRRLWPTA